MKFGEFCKAVWTVSLIGPRLTFRTAEMMVATAQVLTSRMTVFAGAARKPSIAAGLEFNLMIREKIEATSEAVTAAVNFFGNRRKANAPARSGRPSTPASSILIQNKNLWRTLAGALTLLSWIVSLPLRTTLGMVDFFSHVMDPLYSRLMANAVRLKAKKR